MDWRIFQSLLSGSAHYSVHKILLAAMPDWNHAGVVAEMMEQKNMSDSRGTTVDEWFPLNYATINKRLKIRPPTVKIIMSYLLENNLCTTKRIGRPSKSYYKLNMSMVVSIFEKAFLIDIATEPVDISKAVSCASTQAVSCLSIKLKERRTKNNTEAAPEAQGSDEPGVVVRPVLIKRKQSLSKAPDKPTFKNEKIAEVFHYFCGKSILPSHKVDPESRTFQQCQKSIAKALRKNKVKVIKQAIDNYCFVLENKGFHPSIKWNKESLPNFFLLDEHAVKKYLTNKADWARNLDSWFDECVMGVPYLIQKFGNGMVEIDPNPKVTEVMIKHFDKHQDNTTGGAASSDSDKKYFVKAAKIVVDFHQRHKNKINWGGKLMASRSAAVFAPMMIDARFHFSQNDVSMVKPTWFSSEKAATFLIEYLFVKGMLDRSNKKLVLANKADRPENDLAKRNAIRAHEVRLRRRAARVAEEGEE